MTMKRWNGSAYVDLTTAKRWNGSAWVDLTIAKRWNGSAWVDIPLPGGGGGDPGAALVVTVSPGSANRSFSDGDPDCPLYTTNTVTASTINGTGPYTYQWTRVSGSSAVLADSPTSASTSFSASICVGTRQAVFQVKATDSLGAFDTTTVNVTI